MNAKRPKWFKSFLVKYRRSVVFALALGLAASGCAALLMFTSGYLISATAIPGITLFMIMIPVACVQLFGFGRPAARHLERLISHDWVLKITSDLRRMLYWGIESRAGDPERKRAAGEYLGLLSDDVAHLQNLYLRVVFPTAVAILLAVGASIVFGVFSIPFALLMVLVFALVVAVLPNVALLATRVQTAYAKSLRAQEYTSLTDDVLGAADWVLANRGADAVGALRPEHLDGIRLTSFQRGVDGDQPQSADHFGGVADLDRAEEDLVLVHVERFIERVEPLGGDRQRGAGGERHALCLDQVEDGILKDFGVDAQVAEVRLLEAAQDGVGHVADA